MSLMAVQFDVPLVNPAPNGLFPVTNWTEDAGPLRWLPSGVEFRVFNYGGSDAFGEWGAEWCAVTEDLGEDDVKTGERPEFPDAFVAMTTWAYDECDLTKRSRDEVRTRAQQTHRLQEPNAAEARFATRLLTDAAAADVAPDIVGAVGRLEAQLALTNTVGLVHASPRWAAVAAQANLIVRSGAALKTPMGHTWVFGGGYVTGLGDTLVASSPTFGWRGPVEVRDAMKLEHNRFYAIAERSLVIGYEAAVGAVTITPADSNFPGPGNFPGPDNFPEGG